MHISFDSNHAEKIATYTPFKPGRKVHTRQNGSMGGVKAKINDTILNCIVLDITILINYNRINHFI